MAKSTAKAKAGPAKGGADQASGSAGASTALVAVDDSKGKPPRKSLVAQAEAGKGNMPVRRRLGRRDSDEQACYHSNTRGWDFVLLLIAVMLWGCLV